MPICGINCVATGRGIVFRAWLRATHFLFSRRTFMKKLAVVVSVILLLSTLFACSVDNFDISSNVSEEVSSQHQHAFSEATCTKASVCKLCGNTNGEPKGHTYSNGKCISCGEKDPNYTSNEKMVWIPTISGKKYHKNSACSNMNGPRQVTISEAQRLGFTPCKKCY